MKDIWFETNEEKRMIVGIQNSFKILANGCIGNQTLSDVAKRYAPEVFPLSLKIYGMPTLISKNVLIFDPNGGLKNYNNTISGTYTYPAGVTPCSIMINDGKTICGSSCHAWLGYPDSVIYETYDGEIGICRVLYDTEIPNRKNIKFAIGGAGLGINFNPKAEGYAAFTKDGKSYNYSDVWRKTNHTILGVTEDGYKYGVYISNMDANGMNDFCNNKMKFKYCLKLDGGHIAAINSPDFKINTSQNQGSAIQFV